MRFDIDLVMILDGIEGQIRLRSGSSQGRSIQQGRQLLRHLRLR